MGNLVKSVEEGMPYSLVKARMDELTGEKSMYQKLLGEKRIEKKFELTRDQIVEFMEKFTTMDYTDKSCQKVMVSKLINRIYLYSDRVIIGLNYSNEVRPCVIKQEIPHDKRTFVVGDGLFIVADL